MNKHLLHIAKQFEITTEINSIQTLGEGFINDTFLVKTSEKNPDYLLQRKNKQVFQNIPGMMDNIEQISSHLKQKIVEMGGDPDRESITVIKTNNKQSYFKDDQGEFWAMSTYINNHLVYEIADTPQLAYAGGKGIGKFHAMLADFQGDLVDTLPGFHNMKFRYKQWDQALKEDLGARVSSIQEEIKCIENEKKEMLTFWSLIETGEIMRRVTHNDAKLGNILFDENNEVLCIIDLDTILKSTVLNDFGDAIRSYTNTGKEDEVDLSKVSMNMEMFKAYAEGYLSETVSFLSKPEIDSLAFSAKYIIFEQALRFLMDYINNDSYYKIKYPEHNLVRARAQYKLFQSVCEQFEEMEAFIQTTYKKYLS
jgi:Ser/Thr protein kinase RdoA (MazF antagonist)